MITLNQALTIQLNRILLLVDSRLRVGAYGTDNVLWPFDGQKDCSCVN